jgi:hypothetical protein
VTMIMKVFREGVGRVSRAPAMIVGILAVTFLFTLPLGLTLRGMLRAHLGASLAAATVASGVNHGWWQEFAGQAQGVGTTFTPGIIGFAAVLENLSAMLDNRPQAPVVAALLTVYLLLWVFLSGGIIDRYARNRPTRTAAFFAASGVYFFRFLRLAIAAGLVYYVLFAWVHGWLFGLLYDRLTHNLTAERTAFVIRLALYLAFGALLIAVNAVVDYAKVRAVVEDRRSMLGALLAAVRFVRRHAATVFGLYLLDSLVFLVVLAVYAMAAPGAGSVGWSMWIGLLVSQVYVLARIGVKLLFAASETALFQLALAHADYTATPAPVWPESPAAEAIPPPDGRQG